MVPLSAMKRADEPVLAPSVRSRAEEALPPLGAPQSPTTNLDWPGGFLSPLHSVILSPLRQVPSSLLSVGHRELTTPGSHVRGLGAPR